jgi:hypothetical protein
MTAHASTIVKLKVLLLFYFKFYFTFKSLRLTKATLLSLAIIGFLVAVNFIILSDLLTLPDYTRKITTRPLSTKFEKRSFPTNIPTIFKSSKQQPWYHMRSGKTTVGWVVLFFSWAQQLVDDCTCVSSPSPCTKISLAYLSNIVTGGSALKSWSFNMGINRWSHFYFDTRNTFSSGTLKCNTNVKPVMIVLNMYQY